MQNANSHCGAVRVGNEIFGLLVANVVPGIPLPESGPLAPRPSPFGRRPNALLKTINLAL